MEPDADPVRRFFAELEDPAKFHVVRGVPVTKPHDIVRFNQTGKEVNYTVTEADLPRWAKGTNALEQDGVLPIITAGHRLGPRVVQKTSPDGTTVSYVATPDESEQPPVIGYERNFRVGTLQGKPALVCDQYFRADRVDLAREFPFRSIEFFPGTTEIRATALLKRDPQLDLGLIAFANEGGKMADEKKPEETPAVEAPPAAPPVAAPAAGLTPEEIAFVKLCFLASSPMQPAAPEPAAPAVPDAVRMANEQQAIQFAQFNQRMATLEAENKKLQGEREKAVCEQMVVQLEAEHFELDRAYEVGQLVTMGPDARTQRIDYIRKHHTRKPIGQGFIPLGDNPAAGGGKQVTREHSNAAVKLAEEKGISFSAALTQVMGS